MRGFARVVRFPGGRSMCHALRRVHGCPAAEGMVHVGVSDGRGRPLRLACHEARAPVGAGEIRPPLFNYPSYASRAVPVSGAGAQDCCAKFDNPENTHFRRNLREIAVPPQRLPREVGPSGDSRFYADHR